MPILRSAASLLAVLVLAACGQAASNGTAKSSAASAAPAASAQPGAGQTASQQASSGAGFPCTARAGGTAGLPAQLTAVRVGRQQGFDRITFEFATPASAAAGKVSGLPAYRVEPQSSAAFDRDPSGLRMNLDGAAGLRVVFQNSSAVNTTAGSAKPTYTGSNDIKAGLPIVRELALVGDFERVLSWGAGLSSPGCLRVSELSNPTRLAVDVSPASATGAAGRPSSEELMAVAERIYHPVPGGYSAGCETPTWGDQSLCPVTARFLARLQQPRPEYGPGEVDLFCRCQNGDPTIRAITVEPAQDGGVAHVTWGYSHVDLLIKNVDGKLLADDVRCPGGAASTSIYVTPLAGC